MYSYPDPDYDNDDYYITEKASHMQRVRNIYMLIGFGVGIVSTIVFQYAWLWSIGLIN